MNVAVNVNDNAAREKARLRQRVRESRRRRGAVATAELAPLVAAQLDACLAAVSDSTAPLAAFCATRLEPPTEPWLERARSRGNRILLPVPYPDGSLSWVEDTGARGHDDGLNVPIPLGPRAEPEALLGCTAILTPAAAVTRRGDRLGWGGGFYDRHLATLPTRIIRIALVHDDEIVAAVPREPHDIPVDVIVTPSGWEHISAR